MFLIEVMKEIYGSLTNGLLWKSLWDTQYYCIRNFFFASLYEKSDHLNNGLKNETDFVKQEIAFTSFVMKNKGDKWSKNLLKKLYLGKM